MISYIGLLAIRVYVADFHPFCLLSLIYPVKCESDGEVNYEYIEN